MGKNTIERILYLDEMLRNRSFPSKKQIATHFEVSAKTIERDIEYMRDCLGAPVAYDRARAGYCYEEEGYYLPALHMRHDEALALFISHYLGSAWKGTPLADTAQHLWQLLSDLMDEDVLIDTSAFSETVFIADRTVPFDPQLWIHIYSAARTRHKLTALYTAPGHDTPVPRTLRPYRLVHHRSSWYLLAYDEYRKHLLMFSLSRLSQAEALPDQFTIPEDLRIRDMIDPYFGIHIGGEPFQVTIHTDAAFSTIIREHLPANDAGTTEAGPDSRGYTVEPLGDDRVAISFTTNQREELKHWLLPWGSRIEVMQPDWMREELAAIGAYYVQYYGS